MSPDRRGGGSTSPTSKRSFRAKRRAIGIEPWSSDGTADGTRLVAQWLAFDPGGALLGSLSASEGPRIVVGR